MKILRIHLIILATWVFFTVPTVSVQGAPAFPDPSQPDFYRRYQSWVEAQETSDQEFFRDDFSSGSDDFFQEMEAFRREMIQRLQRNEQLIRRSRPEDTFTLNSNPAIKSIFQEEKDDKIFIHIMIPGLEQGKYRVEVREDQLLISGEVQQNKNSPGFQKYAFNHFQKAIPLPSGTDPKSVTYQTHQDKILVIIPKNKANPSLPTPHVSPNAPKTPQVI